MALNRLELKQGYTIKNKRPYNGEGELIVAKILDSGITAIHACNKKFPNLNGCEIGISDYELKYYKIISRA